MPQKMEPILKDGNRPRVLVIDDEPEMCRCLENCLRLLQCTTQSCTSGADGLARLQRESFDVVFTDLQMPEMNGIEVVRSVRRLAVDTDPIILTGYGTIGSAVEAMRAGASDYLTKPFKIAELRAAIEKAIRQRKSSVGGELPHDGLIGSSAAMNNLRKQILQIAGVSSTVLICGETGVGKEIVARAIHARSDRRMRQFVAVNCGAISENLLESELFGYQRGAFTGANEDRPGKVEAAHRGTLFLDEIAETSLSCQTALLRVLQEREVMRIGSNESKKVDFRLLATTNKNLLELVESSQFRQDLYYRLNVVTLDVPPLRAHSDDIPALVEHFIRKHRRSLDSSISGISPNAMNLLTAYNWPGNVRQLENTIEKAMVLSNKPVIDEEDLPAEIAQGSLFVPEDDSLNISLREAKETFERTYLQRILKDSRGNVSEAARQAGVARPYFHERMRKFEIDPQHYRA